MLCKTTYKKSVKSTEMQLYYTTITIYNNCGDHVGVVDMLLLLTINECKSL